MTDVSGGSDKCFLPARGPGRERYRPCWPCTLLAFGAIGRDMNATFVTGIGLTVLGLLGYVVGVGTEYPGRAFSVTAVMVGVTLAAIGRSANSEGVA